MANVDLSKPDFAKNVSFLSHTDQGGRADGMQLMVHKGYAYVAHMFSNGFSVIDVRDPRTPKTVNFIPSPPNTWSTHLQTADNLLLIINAANLFAHKAFADEASYYGQSIGEIFAKQPVDYTAGMRVYDIRNPEEPREIGFLPIDGVGTHRIWYTGGRWAYASALLKGFADFCLITIDMTDPTKPTIAGRWWIPGQNLAAGEKPSWDSNKWRYGLHHALVAGDVAFGAWRDGGMTIIDVKDRTKPELIVHKNWAPPYLGGTHSPLPLMDRNLLLVADEAVADNAEDGIKRTWVFNIEELSNPISISTLPIPEEADYISKGGHFGTHNLHENRPGSFVSSEIIFATYQNAGLRAYDISNQYQPTEIGAWVPPAPKKMYDVRPNRTQVIQSADVFVDSEGIVYMTDYNAGLYIVQFNGA